ncbi:MAG: hypothetical protein WCP99_17700 [Burkholderiales bacterium]
MDYVGGTKEAVALLNRLEKAGCLISVYTKEHIDDLSDEGLIAESYEALVAQHGEDFTDHLLLMHTHGWSKDLSQRFVKVFPAIENAWTDDFLSFIFINLRSQTMIGFGLGAGGEFFAIDIESGHPIHWRELDIELDTAEAHEFCLLDFANIVYRFADAFDDMGYFVNELYQLPYSAEDLYAALENGPDDEGHYSVSGIGTELTLADIDAKRAELEDLIDSLEQSAEMMQVFFPDLNIPDLYPEGN